MHSIFNEKLKSTFAQRLRDVMKEQGIRQTDLCEKAGIGKSAMSQYLNGAFIPKEQRIRAIAKALDVSDGWLLGYNVPRKRIEVVPDDSVLEIVITDNSMERIHIPRGARINVYKCDRDIIKNGDVVCISIGNEKPLVRYYYNKDPFIVLTAANPDFDPIIIDTIKINSGGVILHGIVEKVSFNL